ncbi:MAG: hypothetical protein AAE977_03220 [Thermoplasmataceae archaeon]
MDQFYPGDFAPILTGVYIHMFMSLLAYLFLSLIYNEVHRAKESISLPSTVDIMKDIIVVYAANGKRSWEDWISSRK